MESVAKLNALGADLPQNEEFWLDSRSGAPVSGQMVLEQGRLYSLSLKGTYSLWESYSPLGTTSGKPEPVPMFPSPKGVNKEVGVDPEYVFAWPKNSSLEPSPEPSPRRSNIIEVSLDGGMTWNHPSSTAAFDTADHAYNYVLTGEGSGLQVRLDDSPYSDNYGLVQISVQPAEELWLDSMSGTPILSKMVLEQGRPYRFTMKGTISLWGSYNPLGTKSGKPEPTPQFPSPKGLNKEVGVDPEYVFAWPKSSSLESSPEPSPQRSGIIEVSLDGGKTWNHPSSTESFNTADHLYTYSLIGQASTLQVRLVDSPYSDNYGCVQMFLLPEA